MRDCIEIGSTPSGEDCAQIGAVKYDYWTQARIECRIYINYLRRLFGAEPAGARLRIKSCPHDFGTYYEVVCDFLDDDQTSMDYALKIESETPEYWDDESRRELSAAQYDIGG